MRSWVVAAVAICAGALIWWYAEERAPTLVEPFKAAVRRLTQDPGQMCADSMMELRSRGLPWYIHGAFYKGNRTSLHVAIGYRPGISAVERMVWCICPLEPPGELTEQAAFDASLSDSACMTPLEYERAGLGR